MKAYAAEIRGRLAKRHWTQAEFAVRMGISRHQARRLMRGEVRMTRDMAGRLCLVLGDGDPYLWLMPEMQRPATCASQVTTIANYGQRLRNLQRFKVGA